MFHSELLYPGPEPKTGGTSAVTTPDIATLSPVIVAPAGCQRHWRQVTCQFKVTASGVRAMFKIAEYNCVLEYSLNMRDTVTGRVTTAFRLVVH